MIMGGTKDVNMTMTRKRRLKVAPTILSSFSFRDLELWSMNLTFEPYLLSVQVNQQSI